MREVVDEGFGAFGARERVRQHAAQLVDVAGPVGVGERRDEVARQGAVTEFRGNRVGDRRDVFPARAQRCHRNLEGVARVDQQLG